MELNSSVKYLKSLSDKFLTSFSKLEFINCILSIKTKFLFKKNVMYFSSLFGITSIFTSKPLSSSKIRWLSKPLKLWNIKGTFLVNWRFMFQPQWAAPLNFPVTWPWPYTFSSSSSISFFTNPANVTRLKLFFFFTHDQIFVKVLFHYFFTILILFKNHFNEFISSIFTSRKNYWVSKFIINTNKLVSKTTKNVILIFLWVKTFITFNAL